MILRGRTALVTGAARGIGRSIAVRFAAEGAALILADLADCAATAGIIRDGGGTAWAERVDITDAAAVEAMVARAATHSGTVDILVNNASIIARGTILELSWETWRKVLDVNLNGTFHCCKAVIPQMVRGRYGRILNVSSVAGKTGDLTAAPVYGTSKGAINAFTKSLARQLAPYGITANAVAPHAIDTDMSADWSAQKRAEVVSAIPMARMGRPDEVAGAALFLVSEAASFITGEILDVNGGFLMD